MTLTHFKEGERKANTRTAMVRVEIRDAQGYANQRRHDLRIGGQPAYVNPNTPRTITSCVNAAIMGSVGMSKQASSRL